MGHTLLIHPKGEEPDRRSVLIAERLAPDSANSLVVIDLPTGSLEREWETVAKLLAGSADGVRLVYGRGGWEDVHAVGQLLADRLDRPVLAPDGEPLVTGGGELFIPSERGAGWLCFRPGRIVERESRRYPKTRWEFSTPDRPWELSARGVAESMPSGVWVRSTADLRLNTHRQRLIHVLPSHPDILAVVLGSPGAPKVPLEDVARLWESILPTVRPRVRFVHYGPVALPDGQTLGQALADVLEQQVVLYGGIPVRAGDGFGSPKIRNVRADGWLSGRPFITELAYWPGLDGEPVLPALYGLQTPVPGLRQLSHGVYEYAPDAVLEIVQSGLWMRPPKEPADGEDVRRIPAEPGSPLILFDRSMAENSERMRSLAQDMLWRLDPETREVFRVAPADDPEAVRAIPHEAATYLPVEEEFWNVAAQSAATHSVAPGTARRAAAASQARTAADSKGRRAGRTGGVSPASAGSKASPSGVRAAPDGRDTRKAGSADAPARPKVASRPKPASRPKSASSMPSRVESGPGEPHPEAASAARARTESGSAGSEPRADAEGGSALPPAVRALVESGPDDPDSATPSEDGGADGAGDSGTAGTDQSSEVTGAAAERTESGPAGHEPATDADDHGAGKTGAPDVAPDEAGAAGQREAASPPGTAAPAPQAEGTDGTDAQAAPEPEAPTGPLAAAPAADGAPRPVRAAAPRVRLESDTPDVPQPGADTPAGEPPVPGTPPPDAVRPDAPEQAAPPPTGDPVVPTAPPGQEPPAAGTRAVTVQPVPKAAACAVPPERGLEQERVWIRRTLSEQYNNVASAVSGVLAESPGLRGRSGADASDALTDLVAVRLYLFGDRRGLDRAVRGATVGPHVPLARLVASGLRRLPSYRGPALLHAVLGDAERAWYREGRLATEWAFCSARTSPYAGPAGSSDFLIWSLTARRTNLIDTGAPDRVLFLPGTSFKVLRVQTGERHAVLLRELSPSEIAGDGRAQARRSSLDEIALNGLEQTLKALTGGGSKGAPQAPVGSVGAPPGLIVPSGGKKPPATAGQPQRRKATKK